jgi:hypothetical protein
VITSPGNWCLRADLKTAMSLGTAITLQAPRATLDCRGHALNNLNAGSASRATAVAILDEDAAFSTIRGCRFQGFRIGIDITRDGGNHYATDRRMAVVEDNRFEHTGQYGVYALNAIVRRNEFLQIGGAGGVAWVAAVSIHHYSVAEQNAVQNVHVVDVNQYGEGSAAGIRAPDAVANRVRGVHGLEGGEGYGLFMADTDMPPFDNFIADVDVGIQCYHNTEPMGGNYFMNVATPTSRCTNTLNEIID